jgi:hypothetical protein
MQKLNIDYSQKPLWLENLNKVVAHHFPHVRLEEEGNLLTLYSNDPAMQAKIDSVRVRSVYSIDGDVYCYTYEGWVECIQSMLDNDPPKVYAPAPIDLNEEFPF